MAFENGNSIYNYFSEVLKYYSKDRNIFARALQVLYTFKPHELKYNIKQIDKTFSSLLGVPFTTFAFDGKYIRMEIENKEKLDRGEIDLEYYESSAVWDRNEVFKSFFDDSIKDMPPFEFGYISLESVYDTEMLDSFEREMTIFYLSIVDYIPFTYYIDKPSKSLINIKASYEALDEPPTSLLLVRNDGETFEIELSDDDLDYIIRTIERMNGNGLG